MCVTYRRMCRKRGMKMPYSLRVKIKKLGYKEIITDKECDRLCKALDNEGVLDKIRAEIEHIIDYTYDSTDYDKSLYNGAYKDGLYEALDIIDKYRAESEGKEEKNEKL